MAARVSVLIAAAGAGRRMRRETNKVLLPVAGEPVLRHTVRLFQQHPLVHEVGVVVRAADREAVQQCFADRGAWDKLLPLVVGGEERQDSVYNGLEVLATRAPEWVLVHDGARPLCSAALVQRVLDALREAPGVVPVVPIPDTVRRLVGGHSELVDRSNLFRMQTPQGFHWEPLYEAHRRARSRGLKGTDDAQLLEAAGTALTFVPGEAHNLKVTTAEDLPLVGCLLRYRATGCGSDAEAAELLRLPGEPSQAGGGPPEDP